MLISCAWSGPSALGQPFCLCLFCFRSLHPLVFFVDIEQLDHFPSLNWLSMLELKHLIGVNAKRLSDLLFEGTDYALVVILKGIFSRSRKAI